MLKQPIYEDTYPIPTGDLKLRLSGTAKQHECVYMNAMMNEFAIARMCSCGRTQVCFISMNHILPWQEVPELKKVSE